MNEPSPDATKAAELEIAANHLRERGDCNAPLGHYVQEAINKALEQRAIDTSRG